MCFAGFGYTRALSNAHAVYFIERKNKLHLRQFRAFVPRAHGLSSALNKKVFDVYEIMQPLPLGAVDTGDIEGLKCRD